ncbi:alpha/beta hydrolase family protein [Tomitella cavernea]|uniref:Alpha/beta fold hydrolase n=1 Tax=Tomitella cavernea TaxID=1387982 RepID=A0ABP9C4A5_9ACTN
MCCAAALAVTAGVASACSSGGAPRGGDVPSAQGEAGTLLTADPIETAAALPSAESTRLVTYMSEDAAGKPIVVSGTVSVPRGPAPEGGFPVLSWAHGTSGYADVCAPSQDTADGPDHDYFAGVTAELDKWVQRGFAVVQTDYEGLGTPGGHTYMNGDSAAHTVTDIVRAARQLDGRIGDEWVVAGHSQGGQAALFTAQNAPERAPELDLQAAVSIAPGGTTLRDTVDYIRAGGPGAEAAEAFVPIILLGAEAADPEIDAEALLTDTAHPMLTATRTGCLAQIRQAETVPPEQFFRPDADLAPLTDYLARQEPGAVVPAVPTMIAQGGADAIVLPERTGELVDQLCNVAPVTYRLYAGEDHRGAVPASDADVRGFVAAAMAGEVTPDSCG